MLEDLAAVDPTIAGATFVPLVDVTSSELVLPAIAAHRGIDEGQSDSLIDRLVEDVGDRRHVLVLDNFEHLLAAAGVVTDLTARCPQLRIVVTSRVPLRRRPEHVVSLRPFDPPHGTEPAVLVEHPAVAMFLACAGRSGGTTVDLATVPDVAAICRLLEGSPLAIELAAARTNVMSPRQILDLLAGGSCLEVLRDGPVDLRSGQRDVATGLGRSYRLLGEGEAAMLRRLSVFPGSFSFAAARSVAGGDVGSALDGLSALVDAHLVAADHGSTEHRYRLPLAVRAFAARALDTRPDEGVAARQRHLDPTTRIATAAVRVCQGSRSFDGFRALGSAAADITAGIDEAVVLRDRAAAVRLVLALSVHRQHEGLHLVQPRVLAVVHAMDAPVPPALLAELSGWSAHVDAQRLVNAERSAGRRVERALVAAVDAARASGDVSARLRTLSFVVLAARTLGCLDTGAAAAAEGIDLAEQSGQESWLGRFEAWGGMIAGQRGDQAIAKRLGRRALDRGRRTGDDYVVLRANIVLQPLALAGEIAADEVSAAEAIRLAIGTRDYSARVILSSLAAVEALVAGDLRLAADLCREGLTLAAAANSIPAAIPLMLCLVSVALHASTPALVAELHGMMRIGADMLRSGANPAQLVMIEQTQMYSRRALGDERFEEIQRQGSKVPRAEIIDRAMAIAERLADSAPLGHDGPRRVSRPDECSTVMFTHLL